MKQRTRLIVLAASAMVLAGASRGEAAASPCTDNCYANFNYCMWTEPPEESSYCWERLDMCLARCEG